MAGTDFVLDSGTITFGADDTTQTFEVVIPAGAAANRTVNLALTNPGGGATLGDPHAAVLTIVDGEALPALSIENLASDTGGLHFQVSLSKAEDWAVAFTYTTVDGTAVAGVDYVAGNQTLVILPGETSLVIDVPSIPTAPNVAGKTLSVALSDPLGATVATAEAEGTIMGPATGRIKCGAGAGGASLPIFYALCWVGLAVMKWRQPRGG